MSDVPMLRDRPCPPLLLRVLADEALSSLLFAIDLELDTEQTPSMIDDLGGIAPHVFPFGFDKGHQYYGLWPQPGQALEDAPVVFVDAEGGGSSSVIAGSLGEYLAIVLHAPVERVGSAAPRFVDTVNKIRELPLGIEASWSAPSIDDDDWDGVLAAPSPNAALLDVYRLLRARDPQALERGEALAAACRRLGVARAEDPYACVEAARARYPRFQLHPDGCTCPMH